MKKIITSFLMAIMALGVWAADPEVVFDLTTQTNFDKCTQYKDGSIYTLTYSKPWSFSSSYGPYAGVYYTGVYALATPNIEFEVSEYSVKFNPYLCYTSYDDGTTVKLWLGQGDDLSTYQYLGEATPGTYSYNASEVEIKFVVEEAGEYKIAFETSPYGVYLYKAKVYKYGESSEPKVPTDFNVAPNADGELNVTISFTMPEKTLTGQDLESATYTLYRGDDKIKDQEEAQLGEQVIIKDEVTAEGDYTYHLQVESNNQVSKTVEAKTWVGVETATPPTDVNVRLVDGKFVVSWKAPEIGVHGSLLQKEKLTYSVVRYLDEEETLLTDNLSGVTSFTDEFDYSGLPKLKYAVCAKYVNTEDFTEAAESKTLTIGSVALPFADSFADATLNPLWEQEVFTTTQNFGNNFYWQAKDVSTQPNAEPFDNDGGLLFYNSYMVQADNCCRISTPPVSFNASDNPVLSFARFQQKDAAIDTLKVQIRCDYGEWKDVPNAKWLSGGGDEDAWHFENLPLANEIAEGTKVYEVAFFAHSKYKFNMAVDAVNLFNQIDKDLAIDAFSVSEKAHAGDNLTILIRVANKGLADVTADAYTVEVEHDFTEDFEIGDLKDIPTLGFVTYEVSIPVHSLHLYQVNDFSFTAKVNFDGDQDLSNNESETQVVNASYSEGKGTQIVKSTYDEEGNYYLYWEPAKDLEYVPVNISESFEDFEDDFAGPFNGWVNLDLDKNSYGNYYQTSGSQFNVVADAYNPGGVKNTKDGNNVIGLTVPAKSVQDDWLISPMINCKKGSTMDLDFLFAVKNNTESYITYGVEILYTTAESYDEENPAEAFTNVVAQAKYQNSNRVVPHDETFHRVKFEGIPAEAKYVAIHFNAESTHTAYWMAMWVDDIHLVENDPNPLLGYHVYSFEVGGRLNDELIDADATEFVFKPASVDEPAAAKHRAPALATGEPNVFVAAVYADGEAKAENVWNYADQSVTGIENVSVDSVDGQAEYFNLQGMKVSGDNLTPGIYIIRAGSTSQKVLVK